MPRKQSPDGPFTSAILSADYSTAIELQRLVVNLFNGDVAPDMGRIMRADAMHRRLAIEMLESYAEFRESDPDFMRAGRRLAGQFDSGLSAPAIVGMGTVDDEDLEPECGDCRGWAHFNLGTPSAGIERCDGCKKFASDTEAAAAHAEHCSCGAGVGKPPERCHYCFERFLLNVDETEEGCVTCLTCSPRGNE